MQLVKPTRSLTLQNLFSSLKAIQLSIFLTVFNTGSTDAGMITSEGMQPYEICALCHSLNGVSKMAKFPKLAGQPRRYLEKQIRDFLSQRRTNDGGQMAAIVTEIDPENIGDIAGWFSSQAAPEPDGGKPSPQGAQLFLDYKCNSCHGGKGNQAPFVPYLTAQHEAYLVKQMKDYRDERRTNDDGRLMQKAMATISDDEIAVLANYLANTAR